MLARTRHHAARLGSTASAPKYARVRIETAAHFLTWLTENDGTLAEATQHDVDAWIDGERPPVAGYGTSCAGARLAA